MLFTVSIGLHLCGDGSYIMNRDTYCINVEKLVTVCRGLHTECM